MTNESIDQLARRLAASVPQGLKSMADELEQNFRSVLRSGFGKLDLVTREEFEVQQAVLARTRAMLTDLEARLSELQKALPTKAVKKPAGKPRKKAAKKASAKKNN